MIDDTSAINVNRNLLNLVSRVSLLPGDEVDLLC